MKKLLIVGAAWAAWQAWLRAKPANAGAVFQRLGHPLADVLVWPLNVSQLREAPDYARPDEGGPDDP